MTPELEKIRELYFADEFHGVESDEFAFNEGFNAGVTEMEKREKAAFKNGLEMASNIMTTEYGEALGAGCDNKGAFDCAIDAVNNYSALETK